MFNADLDDKVNISAMIIQSMKEEQKIEYETNRDKPKDTDGHPLSI